MAEDQGKEEEKFDFTGEGEAVNYISLAQARLLAMEHARDNTDFYGPRYAGFSLVWEVVNTEETDEYYDIRLSFRPAGRFRGEPGLEQFIFDKTGNLRMHQLLDEPTGLGDTVDAEARPTPATNPIVTPAVPPSDGPSPIRELSTSTRESTVNMERRRRRRAPPSVYPGSPPDIASTSLFKFRFEDRGDNQFINPFGIAVDVAGNVYVADTGNRRVQVFDSDG